MINLKRMLNYFIRINLEKIWSLYQIVWVERFMSKCIIKMYWIIQLYLIMIKWIYIQNWLLMIKFT